MMFVHQDLMFSLNFFEQCSWNRLNLRRKAAQCGQSPELACIAAWIPPHRLLPIRINTQLFCFPQLYGAMYYAMSLSDFLSNWSGCNPFPLKNRTDEYSPWNRAECPFWVMLWCNRWKHNPCPESPDLLKQPYHGPNTAMMGPVETRV